MSTQPERKSTKPRPHHQRIRVRGQRRKLKFSGWLSGRESYLRVEDPISKSVDWLNGASLYRLAKAIVRQFDAESR